MRTKRLCLAACLALVALAVPTVATAFDAEDSRSQLDLPAELVQAMERDLGVSPAELEARLANEQAASELAGDLESSLDAAFAGAWLTGDEADLTVAVTDAAQAEAVENAGAIPEMVQFSQADLSAVQEAIDAAQAPEGVTGSYIDVTTNSVVVEAVPDAVAVAEQFVGGAAVDPSAVRVEKTEAQPELFYDVIGGDRFWTTQYGCSVGFSVQGGYTTAGHCGTVGEPTTDDNNVDQGTFAGSTFPGSDDAWVEVNSEWTPTPPVNDYAGGAVTVAGSEEAEIGASICRSGATSGWHCGAVLSKDETVEYPDATVYGLTRTDACAEPGDSGGSFISGDQAQGMTSGGSGDCTSGGITFFQPLNPTLERYGLTLVTG